MRDSASGRDASAAPKRDTKPPSSCVPRHPLRIMAESATSTHGFDPSTCPINPACPGHSLPWRSPGRHFAVTGRTFIISGDHVYIVFDDDGRPAVAKGIDV